MEKPTQLRCSFDPSPYGGGMFHCPECGEMVVAGMPHPAWEQLDSLLQQVAPHRTHFINLTNGLLALKDHSLDPAQVRYLRLSSTDCEQKRWEEVLLSLSPEFLLRLALGEECCFYDYGARKEVPRSIWQGLEWVRFALFTSWWGVPYQPQGRVSSCRSYFSACWSRIPAQTKRKLSYFAPLARDRPPSLLLTPVSGSTELDGRKKELFSLLGADRER